MSSDISLTAGMRNNLLSLQNTTANIAQTQGRLSSGKKVNSALDNPTNFFAAQANQNKATDLTNRKDSMSQSIQMVQAANSGITAITSLLQSAQGIATSALATTSVTDRGSFAATYNSLMSQVSQLASDSGYSGTNLLTGSNQTVEFSPSTNAATLQIKGFTATSTGLSIGVAGVSGAGGGTVVTGTSVGTDVKTQSSVAWDTADAAAATLTGDSTGTSAIGSASKQLEGALTTLRSQSASLSANLSVVTARQSFTDSMINVLNTGADNLTLADMNQEGANMLMLQTRQSLGTSSLSMASQAAQSVLKLF
jgi:flagellin